MRTENIQDALGATKRALSGKSSIEELRQVLRFHEHRYYILADPLITDEEYDSIYTQLKQAEAADPSLITPDSPTQRVGGGLNKEFETVAHLVPMLSLDNSYNLDDLVNWDSRLAGLIDHQKLHFSVEPKFDGASISLIYENDLLVRGATRGDGAAGDDITTNIKQIRSVPLSAPFSKYGIRTIEIRGEILLTKANFARFNEGLATEGLPPLANPRNAAAGSLRMKDPAAVGRRKLEAVLYHVSFLAFTEEGTTHFPPQLNTHTGTLQLLSDVGFKTPGHDQKRFPTIAEVMQYCEAFENKRDDLPYEIDGMVVKVDEIDLQQQAGSTTHHPRWAMAYKFKARQATARLLNIEFQVGRTGAITPVGKIEPTPIGGVMVGSVSLFNEGIIAEKDLRIGDTVVVERAGDVIPYIVKPLTELRDGTETEIIFPTHCPACQDALVKPEGEAVWRCVNINCEAQVVERIIHFASKDAMDIKTFGEANVRRFFTENIISDIPSVYEINFNEVAKLEGFGQKSIDNLKQAIDASRHMPLNRLIFGLGIRYVGETTAKVLAKSVDSVFDFKHMTLDQLQHLKDVGPKVGESIFDFFQHEDNIRMLEKLAELGVNTRGLKEEEKTGALSGFTFLFTGTLPTLKRSEAEKLAEENGGKLVSSVSKNLNYLVAGESAGSKLDKAKKLKTVQIITEEEFLHLIPHS